jgi:hypothetical protein
MEYRVLALALLALFLNSPPTKHIHIPHGLFSAQQAPSQTKKVVKQHKTAQPSLEQHCIA